MDDVQGAEVVQRAADLAHHEADLLLVQVTGVGQVVPVRKCFRVSGCPWLLDFVSALKHDSPQITSHQGFKYYEQVLGVLVRPQNIIKLLYQIEN